MENPWRVKNLKNKLQNLFSILPWPNIPGRLHQSPAAQLAEELNIPVDWNMGLHRNRDEFTL